MTADAPKPLLPPPAEVAVIVLHVLRHKLEFLDAINFNKSEVKLARERKRCSYSCCAGEGTALWSPMRVGQFSECAQPSLRTGPLGSALSRSVQLPGQLQMEKI